jgi:hypothetical protein
MNAMNVLVTKSGPNRLESLEEGARRTMRVTLLLSVTISAVALAYFVGLYLITH